MGRVLYLDDDVPLAGLVAQWLERFGHSMAAHSDAAEALTVFAGDPMGFDLVLTDMSMPGANGIEFARQVLNVRPDMRVFIASGCEDPNWAGYALSVGVTAVLLKPFHAKDFAEDICRLLGA